MLHQIPPGTREANGHSGGPALPRPFDRQALERLPKPSAADPPYCGWWRVEETHSTGEATR